ncbi:hypothetical protein IAT38_005329 [Cryptococcus sp. DSM 104549]
MSKSVPAWVPILKGQLKENPKSVAYAFSTLSEKGKPKVRHVIHRDLTPSNLLLTTTDTRVSKPKHLAHSHTVELAWWIEPSLVQFRISGEAYIISEPGHIKEAAKALAVEGTEEGEEAYWQKKKDELWDNVSGHLRAGFGRPTPGTSLDDVEDSSKWPETIATSSDDAEEQKKIDEALSHFAIIAIRPEAVEFLELKPIPNRRTQYKWNKTGSPDDGANWKEVKVVP